MSRGASRVWLLAIALAACAGPVPPDECLGLAKQACRSDPVCVAVPYWGESVAACEIDDRGFADNCPWVACRSAVMRCPTLDELTDECPLDCPLNAYALDPETGCRICRCEAVNS